MTKIPPPLNSRNDIIEALNSEGILVHLAAFNPQLVGSVELDVHHANSDIDICCGTDDLTLFQHALEHMPLEPLIPPKRNVFEGQPAVIAKFRLGERIVEVYARAHPIEDHPSYRWTKAGRRILALLGNDLRIAVARKKLAGMNTEEAFCSCLGLEGDARPSLLAFAASADEVIQAKAAAAPFKRN